MSRALPSLSTEQIAAFVELARLGSLHRAAQSMHLSDEGLRARILSLENALGAALYEKARGRRGDVNLTAAGRKFLQKAVRFLEQAHELVGLFDPRPAAAREIQLLGSHYLMAYVLTEAVREFRAHYPEFLLRLSTRAESQIFGLLLGEAHCAIGACTPTDFPRGLTFHPWRNVGWSVALPRAHPRACAKSIGLAEIAGEPLIAFERNSAGRLHVLETFFALGIEPHIALEATSTPLMLSMVDAGLGIAIVPTPSTPTPLRGLDVVTIPITDPIRPIETGLYLRSEWDGDPAVQALLACMLKSSA
jgi:DNA-binding transcriptional LysR family regulator